MLSQAVKNTINLQKPTKPLILHSDLGCQYTSSAFKDYIESTKLIMGFPYDNAYIESFHASLKKEEAYLVKYFDYDAVRLAIFEYIEAWYNRERIHGSIGYSTPQKCEDLARKSSTFLSNILTLIQPPSEKQVQSWKTFLKNHSKIIWAMDYFVVPTLFFKILYVLIIINHGSKKIEHFAVTTNSNLDWVKQQIRNANPYDYKPKYLIHDNDAVFVCEAFLSFLSNLGIKSKRTSYYSPWQNGIAERVNGIIRQELTNHIIPINEAHLYRLLKEYINDYYNAHQIHQGIYCKIPTPVPKYLPTKLEDSKLQATPVLNGLYNSCK